MNDMYAVNQFDEGWVSGHEKGYGEGFRDGRKQFERALVEAREALQTSRIAINDWICTYADDCVGEEAWKEACMRIKENHGTLAYTATVGQRIDAALAKINAVLDDEK